MLLLQQRMKPIVGRPWSPSRPAAPHTPVLLDSGTLLPKNPSAVRGLPRARAFRFSKQKWGATPPVSSRRQHRAGRVRGAGRRCPPRSPQPWCLADLVHRM